MKDDALIAAAKAGDRAAAEELNDRYYGAILRYCRFHCPSREQAEDLTQETFLRLFSGLGGYQSRGTFSAYLYKIAYHLCVDEARRPGWQPLEETEKDPRDAMEEAENRQMAEKLLKGLSPEQREAVLLRYGEGLSLRETAQVTGVPLRTVQSRIRLALKAMRTEAQKPKNREDG